MFFVVINISKKAIFILILRSQNQQFFFKDQRGLPNLIYRTPLNNFLIAYRLKMAAKKIAETDDKIVNISTDCGFNNQSYFSRAFTKHFKMSPAEYRNKH